MDFVNGRAGAFDAILSSHHDVLLGGSQYEFVVGILRECR